VTEVTTEVVGGAIAASPTTASHGRTARLRELAPFAPAGLILVGLFFVPLGLMFVFSLWDTNENLDVVPTWSLQNYQSFFENPAYVRTLAKTLVMGAGVTLVSLVASFAVAYFLARYVSRRGRDWRAIIALTVVRAHSCRRSGEKGASTRCLGLGLISSRQVVRHNESGRSSS
jgi:hypothetical protein